MGHDRSPPSGYLKRRGVNIWIRRPAASRAEALSRADFAVKAGPGLWAPFDSPDHAWVIESFSGYGLAQKFTRNEALAEDNLLRIDERLYVGEAFLGRFTKGLDGWRVAEGTVTNYGDHVNGARQEGLSAYVGAGFLTSWHPDRGDDSTGRALSPEFTAADGQHLVFLVGGGGAIPLSAYDCWRTAARSEYGVDGRQQDSVWSRTRCRTWPGKACSWSSSTSPPKAGVTSTWIT